MTTPNPDVAEQAPATATSERPKPKRFSMIRSFALADFITLANAYAGMGAILSCMAYVATGERVSVITAFIALPVALVCDALDGSVARWRRKSSPLGGDLDSLADIVSFGVAPAVLAFALGMRGGWDAVCLGYFVACGISRLARYNATMDQLSDETGKVSHYEGTPIPTSLGLVAMLGVAYWQGRVGNDLWWGALEIGPFLLHPIVLTYVVSGSFMISTFRVPKP